MSRHFQVLSLLESQEFCCAFMSQYDVGDTMSIRSLLSCVFYSWTSGRASFVKTATAAVARVLMVAAHLWIEEAAKREAEAMRCKLSLYCDRQITESVCYLSSYCFNDNCSLFNFPKGCKVVRSK